MKEKKSTLLQGIVIGFLSCVLIMLCYNIVQNTTIFGKEQQLSLTDKSVIKKLHEVETLIQGNYYNPVDEQLVVDDMFRGLAVGLEDTYSVYYTQDEYKAITEETQGEYKGIGIVIQQDPETKEIFVGKCYEGAPAQKAGVIAGDIIQTINGKSITELTVTEIGEIIRDQDVEEVTISILRKTENKTYDFTMKKEYVEVQMVSHKMLTDDIGYIRINEFTKVSAPQLKIAYQELISQGMQKLVFDLRNNPGGLVTSVQDIADMFLDKDQLIVYTENKEKERLEYKSKTDKVITVPFVLLVNEHSASASEIFAGVVKDYKLGTIVGQTTFGKGIVQKIFPLKDQSALKLTISSYFTPNGSNIHKKGITPDEVVPMDVKDMISDTDDSKDVQLKKAIDILNK